MSSGMEKYIGLDVHKAATSIAVLNGVGKLVMRSIIETKTATLLEFLHGFVERSGQSVAARRRQPRPCP